MCHKISLAQRLWQFKEYSTSSKTKRKVPPTYSRADDGARSLSGRRDDELEETQ